MSICAAGIKAHGKPAVTPQKQIPRSEHEPSRLKISPVQFAAAEAALAQTLSMMQPADAVLSGFFRSEHRLGQNDREFVADTVFGVLRRRYTLEYHTAAGTSRQLILAYLNRIRGVSLRQLEPLLARSDMTWVTQLKDAPVSPPPLNVAAELPSWLVAMLSYERSDDEILAIGRTLQQAAPLDLRVNSWSASRAEVLDQFARTGIVAQPTPFSPAGIRLVNKPNLYRHPLYLSGKIEIQDEGSQIVCHLLAPKRREMVVDFCAGAGGKTLMLGAMMQSHGRIYAFDVSEPRLNKLKPRLKRSALSNIHPQLLSNENDIKVKRLAGKIDRVLVDAPCSGFGTLRRNPDLKWRQSPESVAELTLKQRAILNAAAQLVTPGGRLVYATCSFLRAENQDIIAGFLATHPKFTVLPANEVLRQQRIPLDTGEFLELYPHRHGCDGFFGAVMECTR